MAPLFSHFLRQQANAKAAKDAKDLAKRDLAKKQLAEVKVKEALAAKLRKEDAAKKKQQQHQAKQRKDAEAAKAKLKKEKKKEKEKEAAALEKEKEKKAFEAIFAAVRDFFACFSLTFSSLFAFPHFRSLLPRVCVFRMFVTLTFRSLFVCVLYVCASCGSFRAFVFCFRGVFRSGLVCLDRLKPRKWRGWRSSRSRSRSKS